VGERFGHHSVHERRADAFAGYARRGAELLNLDWMQRMMMAAGLLGIARQKPVNGRPPRCLSGKFAAKLGW
jgi:hypothetical protein